jgi:hypothetical protein
MCAECVRLSDLVTKAIKDTYTTKEAHDRAVLALNKHRTEHGC